MNRADQECLAEPGRYSAGKDWTSLRARRQQLKWTLFQIDLQPDHRLNAGILAGFGKFNRSSQEVMISKPNEDMPQALAACTKLVGVIKPSCKEKAEWVVRWTYIRTIVNVPAID